MSWATVRTQLETILEGVTGIGVVHDYQRWSIEASDDAALFVSNGRINVWMITRDQSLEDHEAQNQDYRRHQVKVFGLYSLDDSDGTEKAFSDLLETICDTLRQNNSINSAAESSGPPSVTRDDHTMFRRTLCHFGEISIEIREDMTF